MLDREGLQVAFLGVALAHYLDLENGDILDVALDAEPPGPESRFLRIPTRTPESEREDRMRFAETVKFSLMRDRLVGVVDDARAYRTVLSEDRFVERSFFNFKNDRASEAIEEWLLETGLSD